MNLFYLIPLYLEMEAKETICDINTDSEYLNSKKQFKHSIERYKNENNNLTNENYELCNSITDSLETFDKKILDYYNNKSCKILRMSFYNYFDSKTIDSLMNGNKKDISFLNFCKEFKKWINDCAEHFVIFNKMEEYEKLITDISEALDILLKEEKTFLE